MELANPSHSDPQQTWKGGEKGREQGQMSVPSLHSCFVQELISQILYEVNLSHLAYEDTEAHGGWSPCHMPACHL